ncbi:unnamed protein product [Schistosoma mattheei]|uniref:BHLH domain-containing protein n=1 Tax=Schistosoma mattheei TaxID=31246 RepID=A0A183P0D7_9TREM|nr:unnamed protein product [Schistosoma mattheei]VDP41603.1 unnamed protein product [Schistosoma mattheei]
MSMNSYGKRNWSNQDYLLTNYTQHYNDKQKNLSYCLTDHFNQCSTIHDTTTSNNNDSSNDNTIEHIPISSSSSSSTSLSQYQPPIKRVANERERTRTASVNDAFLMLRNLIPTEPMNRKLSKIETLRLASSYISHLHAILITGSGPADQPCLKHQQIYHLETTHNDISSTNTTTTTTNPIHENLIDKTQIMFNSNKRYNNRSVCTFCVTEMKQHQRTMNKETIISNGQ